VGTANLPYSLTGLQASGKHVYAAANQYVLAVDVSNPASPALVNNSAATAAGFTRKVAVHGGYMYAMHQLGFDAYTLTAGSGGVTMSPTYYVGGNGYNGGGGFYGPQPGSLAVSGNLVLAAGGTSGLQIYLATAVRGIQLQSSFTPSSDPGAGFVYGEMLVHANGNSPMTAWYANPSSPTVYANNATTGSLAYHVASAGDLAVATDYTGGGVYGYRVQHNGTMAAAGSYTPATFHSYGVAVRWPFAYVAGYSGTPAGGNQTPNSFRIVELRGYTVVGSLALTANAGGTASSVAIYGNYAYVTNGSSSSGTLNTNSVYILDISNPASPSVAGHVDLNSQNASELAIFGHNLYLTTNAGVRVMSLANPTSPSDIGGFSLGFGPRTITVSGTYIYVGGTGTLAVLDGSQPSAVALLGNYSFGVDARSIIPMGNYITVLNYAKPAYFLLMR
jgi:hypothetical protein